MRAFASSTLPRGGGSPLAIHVYNIGKCFTYQRPKATRKTFFALKMRRAKMSNEIWYEVFLRFLITVSLCDTGSMGQMNEFPFLNVLYAEHKNRSSKGGHKSLLCFLMIANWNISKGWFDSWFDFPNEWHQMEKQRTAYTEDAAFLFFPFSICELKNRKEYRSNVSCFYFPFSVCK